MVKDSSISSLPYYSAPVLVSCAETSVNHHLRSSLQELGFSDIAGVFDHGEALEKCRKTNFFAVFFDSYATDMEPRDFIEQALSLSPECALIAVADNLRIDEVFELLRVGARGFLVEPFTGDAVEKSLAYADKVASICPDLLETENVEASVVEAVLNNFGALYRLMSLKQRGASSYELNQLISERKRAFRESAELAKSLIPEEQYIDTVVERCIEYAKGRLSRLSRIRRDLRARREAKNKLLQEHKREGSDF